MNVRPPIGRRARRVFPVLRGWCLIFAGLASIWAWAGPPVPEDSAPVPPPELQMAEADAVVEPVAFEDYEPPREAGDFAAIAKAVEPISLEGDQTSLDLPGATRAARVYRVVQVKPATGADAAADPPTAEGIAAHGLRKLARAYRITAVFDASDTVDPTKYGFPKGTKVAQVQLLPMGHRIVEVKEVSADQEEQQEAAEPKTPSPSDGPPADQSAETANPFADDNEDQAQAPASPTSIAAMGFAPIGEVGVDTSIKRDPQVADELQQPKDEAVVLFLAHGEQKDVPRVGHVGLDEWFFLEPARFCHQPLYFEEVNLERFGTSRLPRLQPVVSGARFFVTVPALPYLMAVERPRACYYEDGAYVAGRPAPWHKELPPLRLSGATAEGAAITALIFAIP